MASKPTESFHIEEYKALREEILYLVRQSYLFETTVFVGLGAIYGWLFSSADRAVNEAIWWLPVVIAVLGIIRETGIRVRLLQMSEYIRSLESKLVAPDIGGWEHHLKTLRRASPSVLLGISSAVVWFAILVVTLLVALGFFR